MRADALRVHLFEDSPIMARLLRDLVSETAIVDIGLTHGNGFEVVEALVKQETRPLAFVLTNHALKPYREGAARLGADAFTTSTMEQSSCFAP